MSHRTRNLLNYPFAVFVNGKIYSQHKNLKAALKARGSAAKTFQSSAVLVKVARSGATHYSAMREF